MIFIIQLVRVCRRKPIIPRFTTNVARKQRSLIFQAVAAIEYAREMGTSRSSHLIIVNSGKQSSASCSGRADGLN